MGWRKLAWPTVLACAACFDPKPPQGIACGDGSACPAGLVCELGLCVSPGGGAPVDAPETSDAAVDGAIDATPDAAPDAAPCTAACAGADLVCGAEATTCTLGCSETGGAHCMQIVPSNGLTWPASDTDALTLMGAVRIDTSTGEIRNLDANTVIRAAGTGVIAGVSFEVTGGIGVFAMDSLIVAAGADVRTVGSRPLGLLVDGDVTIDGVIDTSGGCAGGGKSCAGAGGGTGGTDTADATGCGRGARGRDDADTGSSHGEGGGGAGAREPGARGAGETAGGMACGTTSLVPLTAGSVGGRGGDSQGGDGGGGGGALQITATGTITISATGIIDAGGAGGESGAGSNGAGGGGGSGGAIFLEAATVNVLGIAVANGGAGGGHDPDEGDGEDGRRSTSAAQGTGGSWGGGNGGTGTSAPTGGRTSDDHGGGGGGAAGRIRVLGVMRDLSGVVSPAAATGTPMTM